MKFNITEGIHVCSDKYQPIRCFQYDVYEIAIMRNKFLELKWLDNNDVKQHQKVKPVNLKILNGAEYLIVELEVNDEVLISEIRLDKIIETK